MKIVIANNKYIQYSYNYSTAGDGDDCTRWGFDFKLKLHYINSVFNIHIKNIK
jgi:hypothetical protein